MVKKIIRMAKKIIITILIVFLIFKDQKTLKLSSSIQNFTINLFPIYQTNFLTPLEGSKIKNMLQGSYQAQKRFNGTHHGEDILQLSH